MADASSKVSQPVPFDDLPQAEKEDWKVFWDQARPERAASAPDSKPGDRYPTTITMAEVRTAMRSMEWPRLWIRPSGIRDIALEDKD